MLDILFLESNIVNIISLHNPQFKAAGLLVVLTIMCYPH